MGILWDGHFGEQNKMSADELALRFDRALNGSEVTDDTVRTALWNLKAYRREYLEARKRDVRKMHNHLLMKHNNIPLYSAAGAGGGYWLGESEDEGMSFYNTFRKRAMTGMTKASRGRKAVMIEMMAQLTFDFDELVDEAGIEEDIKGRTVSSASIAVVDAALSKMMANPERYADDLRKLGSKFSSVLLPKSQAAAIKTKAEELQRIVASIGV